MLAALVSFLAGGFLALLVCAFAAHGILLRLRRRLDGRLRELERERRANAVLRDRQALLPVIRDLALRAAESARGLGQLLSAIGRAFEARRVWLLSPCASDETISVWEARPDGPLEVRRRTLSCDAVAPLLDLTLRSDGALSIAAHAEIPPSRDPLAGPRRWFREAGSDGALVAALRPRAARPWVIGIEVAAAGKTWEEGERLLLEEIAEVLAAEFDRAALREAVVILKGRLRERASAMRDGPARTADINAVVERVAELLRRSGSRRVDLGLAGPLPPAAADPAEIEHVLVNIGLNARDAAAAAGEIRIETRAIEKGGARCFVEVRVRDEGAGMAPDVVRRAFARGYTTKPGRAGLGLWVARRIARRLGGDVTLSSRPGRGTTCCVRLPAVVPPRRPAGRTVLVVEDEEPVLRMAVRTLQRRGYRTLAATNGREALEVLAREPGIDVIVLDLHMPVMDGDECLRRLRELRGDVKVILSSGTPPVDRAPPAPSGAVMPLRFLRKPYRPRELEEAVRLAIMG